MQNAKLRNAGRNLIGCTTIRPVPKVGSAAVPLPPRLRRGTFPPGEGIWGERASDMRFLYRRRSRLLHFAFFFRKRKIREGEKSPSRMCFGN